jgi:hypothetical protein
MSKIRTTDSVLYEHWMESFDVNGDGYITFDEFQYGFKLMLNDWKTLRRSWSSHQTVSRAFHLSTLVGFFIGSFILWMLVFRVSPTTVLLPMVRASEWQFVRSACRVIHRSAQPSLPTLPSLA